MCCVCIQGFEAHFFRTKYLFPFIIFYFLLPIYNSQFSFIFLFHFSFFLFPDSAPGSMHPVSYPIIFLNLRHDAIHMSLDLAMT